MKPDELREKYLDFFETKGSGWCCPGHIGEAADDDAGHVFEYSGVTQLHQGSIDRVEVFRHFFEEQQGTIECW